MCTPGWIGCIPALGERAPWSSPVFIKINEQVDIFSPLSESIILILMRASGECRPAERILWPRGAC